MPIQLCLFVIPFIASIMILIIPASGKFIKRLAFVLSLIPLVCLCYFHQALIGSEVSYSWIPSLSINFFMKIDELTLIFLYLTAIIIPISILSVNCSKLGRPNLFYFFVFVLQSLLNAFFMARDLALFTIFWEAMLLPLYFIISLWGGEHKQHAALKFLVYMIAGSALMIAAVLFLFYGSLALGKGSFNLDVLKEIAATVPYAKWIFAIFLLAFAVKTPLFPFHAWLPDAYYQAPIPGTILLSSILSKAGVYGILRIAMELFPEMLKEWSPFLLGLAITGVFYGGLAAWVQNDFKRLIAYSSFSHMNFILAGLFIWQEPAQAGAILQSFNHAITIAGLFIVSGWLEERTKNTAISPLGGMARYFPYLCWITLIFVLSSVALPGTNSFIGELMILFGLFGENPYLAAVLGCSIILSVVYMLRYMQKIYFGPVVPIQSSWKDIGIKELLIAFPIIALIFWIGFYPSPLLNMIKPAINNILTLANGVPS